MLQNLKIFRRVSEIIILLSIFYIILSCNENLVKITEPLFSVSEPEYRSNEEDERCLLGGVYFDFYNKAGCNVVFIEIRMNVYDKTTGTSAFTGYGTIISENEVVVSSNEKRELCVPLDDYITVISQSGYFIDQFYVSKIEYEDGRQWSDDLGLYAISSRE